MSSAEDPAVKQKGTGGVLAALWIFAGVGALYFGFFILLWLDEVAFRTRWIPTFLRGISPALEDRVHDAFQTAYFPLLYLMKRFKLLPFS